MTPDRAAERSVIGALLLEPDRFADVREWLEPGDFHGTAERQAYEAICAVGARGQELSAAAVDHELRDRRTSAPLLADGAYLVGCMQLCPTPARAPVYGRMVLEMSIRRRVVDHGTRLRQRAEKAVTSHDLNLVFAQVDSARRNVERLHQREAQATSSRSPTPLLAPDLNSLPRRGSREDVPAERNAIHALVDQPSALGVVSRWLSPTDFSDAECSGLYGEMTALHEAKKPIDRVTLAWRAMRVGVTGPVCDSLVSPRGPASVAGDPVRASREVLQQSVRASVLSTADVLEGMTRDVSGDVTSEAYARLNSLWPQQRRLIKAGLPNP
ncbi:MAG: DnaB-like helicase N-terminal domain-containing protein [Actinomycetota bacterium]